MIIKQYYTNPYVRLFCKMVHEVGFNLKYNEYTRDDLVFIAQMHHYVELLDGEVSEIEITTAQKNLRALAHFKLAQRKMNLQTVKQVKKATFKPKQLTLQLA